ncbi:MAG: hypothetical protein LBQ93_06920 [Treponema sp.]|jgi:hypothetical protein|nr:hypothetical protein [Treponema sp.]
MVNGKTAEAELNTRRAADGRHPPFITSFALPASHIAWPEGTMMAAGATTGSAMAASATGTVDLIGVLETRVDADEQSGNVMIHGSCAADILKYVDDGELVDAGEEQIIALRGIGIYV